MARFKFLTTLRSKVEPEPRPCRIRVCHHRVTSVSSTQDSGARDGASLFFQSEGRDALLLSKPVALAFPFRLAVRDPSLLPGTPTLSPWALTRRLAAHPDWLHIQRQSQSRCLSSQCTHEVPFIASPAYHKHLSTTKRCITPWPGSKTVAER